MRLYGEDAVPLNVEKMEFYRRIYDLIKPDRQLVETETIMDGPFLTNMDAIEKDSMTFQQVEKMFDVCTFMHFC